MTEKPKLVYDAPKRQHLYEWQVGEYLWASEPVFDRTREYVEVLEAENAKLREERNHWHVEQVHAYSNWEDAHKRATELGLENAKLRELVQYTCDECYGDEWFVEKAAALGIEGHY